MATGTKAVDRADSGMDKVEYMIEASSFEYTILRPTWFTNADEADYETTRKGESEKGSVMIAFSSSLTRGNLQDFSENVQPAVGMPLAVTWSVR